MPARRWYHAGRDIFSHHLQVPNTLYSKYLYDLLLPASSIWSTNLTS